MDSACDYGSVAGGVTPELELRASRCSRHSGSGGAGGWRHVAAPPSLSVRLCARDYAVPPCGDATSTLLLKLALQAPPVASLIVTHVFKGKLEIVTRVYFGPSSVPNFNLEHLSRGTTCALRWQDEAQHNTEKFSKLQITFYDSGSCALFADFISGLLNRPQLGSRVQCRISQPRCSQNAAVGDQSRYNNSQVFYSQHLDSNLTPLYPLTQPPMLPLQNCDYASHCTSVLENKDHSRYSRAMIENKRDALQVPNSSQGGFCSGAEPLFLDQRSRMYLENKPTAITFKPPSDNENFGLAQSEKKSLFNPAVSQNSENYLKASQKNALFQIISEKSKLDMFLKHVEDVESIILGSPELSSAFGLLMEQMKKD